MNNFNLNKNLNILFGSFLILGLLAMAVCVAAPFFGLGENEDFILFRLAGWTRTDLSIAGIFYCILILLAILAVNNRILIKYFFPKTPTRVFPALDQKILLCAAIIFQTVYLFIIPLAFECDAGMYVNYAKVLFGVDGGGYTYYRPPGFPVFLGLTGQLIFHSFIGTVITHAVMGVIMPVLLYRIILPVNRLAAFICASVFIFSTIPFFAAKIMLAEQLYSFLFIGMIYFFSRYYFDKESRHIYPTILTCGLAMFVRWEATVPLMLLVVILLIIGRREKKHYRHVFLSLAVVAAVTTLYSFGRSQALHQPELFGSLHNGTSRQMFYRVYRDLTPYALYWHKVLNLPEPGKEDFVNLNNLINAPFTSNNNFDGLRLVDPANGPASKRLLELIATMAKENPEGYRATKKYIDEAYQSPEWPRRDLYQEHFGRFDGNEDGLAKNIFDQPSPFYSDYISSALNNKLGILKSDELLTDVVFEAIFAHPVAFMPMLSQAITIFGVDPSALAKSLKEATWNNPFLKFWGENHYSRVGIDTTGCARDILPPQMIRENKWDNQITFPLTDSNAFKVGNTMRNLVRNLVGPLALLTWWFIPFTAYRAFWFFITLSVFPLIGVTSIAGTGGAYTRYELAIQPLILLVTTGAILSLIKLLHRLYSGNRSHSRSES